ncbi:MAG: hypothetical protein JNK05_20330 [Myxococcales bacterium]|nr:hypothetical protein [Myxococcales bacterium]
MTTELTIADPAALRTRALDLFRAPSSELERALREGVAPSFDELLGWEFDGINVGFVPGLLGIRKFRKGFYDGRPRVARGPEPFIHGYNIPVRQDGVDHAHRAKPSDEAPKRFGFYRVYSASLAEVHRRYPNALLLDYGLGANGLDPSGLLRDYLVKVDGSRDLLLGKAYLALGPIKPFVGFFVLRRSLRHTYSG